MSTLLGAHFEEPAKRYQRRDPRLHAELKRKFAEPPYAMVDEVRRKMALTEVPLLDDRGEITPHGRAVAETIVNATARPVLVIRDNRATTEFLGPDSEVW